MKLLKNSLSLGLSAMALAFAGPALAQHEGHEGHEGHENHQSTPTTVATTSVPAAEVEVATPALWKVADEDSTIYLFGTVHALPEGLEWYAGPVKDALESADILVTEIPMGKEDEAKMAQYALAQGMLPEGTTLRSLLDEEENATYAEAMGKLGMPANAFDRFEPWMASLTLTMLPLLQQGYSADAGVEKRLINIAGEDMAKGALETIEFQIGIFDGMPQDEQVDFLISTAGQVDKAKPMLDEMVAEWVEGDPDGLAELMNKGFEDDAELAEVLLYKRNEDWAGKIEEKLEGAGVIFIAVGAGHLAGDRSVQDYLAERGIETVRVQ